MSSAFYSPHFCPHCIFRSNDGSSSFLSFWNGVSWTRIGKGTVIACLLVHSSFRCTGSTLQGATNVSQLAMVPLQDVHTANGVIEPDRMLMVSGLLADSSFGNASSALFDGETFIPYIVSTSSLGTPGSVSSLFHSFSTFSFVQHREEFHLSRRSRRLKLFLQISWRLALSFSSASQSLLE